MFRASPCSSSGRLRRNYCIYAASGIVTVCRWLSCSPVKKDYYYYYYYYYCLILLSWKPLSVTLVDLQLDAQNSYLFTYNIFIKILYMFRASPCSSSGRLRRNYCIYAASGIVTVCRWLSCAPVKKELFFLNRYTGQSPADSDDTRGCIYTITT